jgi:hypothetical protein
MSFIRGLQSADWSTAFRTGGKRAAFLVLILWIPVCLPAQPIPGVDISPFGSQCVWPVNTDLVTYLDRMQEAGIQWARTELCWWSLAETTQGVYNFTHPNVPGWEGWNTDRAITLMRERGIEPFPILCYGNGLYDEGKGPYSEYGRTGFANYCYAAAERYRDSVTYWEIWNEPNMAHFWARDPDPADYARLALAAAPRIRQANPNAVIAGGVTAGIDLGFLTTAFQNGLLDAVDIVTVHPYRIAPPESINGEIATLRSMIASHTDRQIEVWTGEWGYNTFWTEVTPLGQAKCLARMMVNNLSQGIGLSVWFSIHAFKEADPSGTDPEWGLLDYALQPRPSFHAMRVLNQRFPAPARHTTEGPAATLSPPLPQQRIETFERGDEDHFTVAIWLARWPLSDGFQGMTTTVTIGVPPNASVVAYDGLTGEPISLTADRVPQGLELDNFRVMDYPIYVDIDLPQDGSAYWFFY